MQIHAGNLRNQKARAQRAREIRTMACFSISAMARHSGWNTSTRSMIICRRRNGVGWKSKKRNGPTRPSLKAPRHLSHKLPDALLSYQLSRHQTERQHQSDQFRLRRGYRSNGRHDRRTMPNTVQTSTPVNLQSDRVRRRPTPFLSLITSFVMGYRRPSGEVGWGRAIPVSPDFPCFL